MSWQGEEQLVESALELLYEQFGVEVGDISDECMEKLVDGYIEGRSEDDFEPFPEDMIGGYKRQQEDKLIRRG